MISPSRILAVILRQWYEFINQWSRIFDSFIWPIIDIFIWGLTFFYIQSAVPEITFMKVILGGVIFWTFVYSIQRDIALGIMTDVWDRNLYNIFSTALTTTELILGSIATSLMKMSILSVLVTGTAYLVYGFNILEFFPMLFPALMTLTLFAIAFGILMSAFIFHMGSHVSTLLWSALGLLMPFLCIYYPVSALPDSLESVALLLPPTHVFEFVRAFVNTATVPSLSAWIFPNFLNLLLLSISIFYFSYAFKNAKRRGWLVKMD